MATVAERAEREAVQAERDAQALAHATGHPVTQQERADLARLGLPGTYDNAAYTRGWKASERASDGALERADNRGEPDAWYDGYMDYACGRERGHSKTCSNHDDH